MLIRLIKKLVERICRCPPVRRVDGCASRCIVAPKGTGKSALETFLAELAHNDKYRREMSFKTIREYNAGGFTSLEPLETLVYADTSIAFRDYLTCKMFSENELNPFELQIPSSVDKSVLLAPYSTLFVDECYRYWGNRNSAQFPERVEAWFFMQRHFHVDLNLFFQTKDALDVKIRENLTEYWHLQGFKIKYYFRRKDKDGFRQIKSIKWLYHKYFEWKYFDQEIQPLRWWQCLWCAWKLYNPSMWFPFNLFDRAFKHNVREEYKQKVELASHVERKTIKAQYNVFEFYDTHFFEPVQFKYCGDSARYKEWAQSLSFKVTRGKRYRRNMSDFYKFNKRVVSERPEQYTKTTRARSIRKRKEKNKD